MGQYRQPPRFDREYNLAFSDKSRSDIVAVLLGLSLVGFAVAWGAFAIWGEDVEASTPAPETVAGCEAWKSFRANTAGADAEEKLARMPDLDVLEYQLPRTTGQMIQQARAELVDGGEHFDNYARQVDARCEEVLERADGGHA